MPATPPQLSLSITNPLILYRTLVATKKIKPDPAQHRLALQLQKLYFRLKDYAPEVEYRYRLEKIGRSVPRSQRSTLSSTETHGGRDGTQQRRRAAEKDGDGDDGNDEKNNSRKSRQAKGGGILSSLLSLRSLPSTTLALTRTTPLHHSALSIDSPMGMLLYGEVGRGKSMLLDLLYEALPSRKKRRWHFNTFMLDIFRRIELGRIERLESLRRRSSSSSSTARSLFGSTVSDHEHVILSLAKDTISDSPILFLDEFQMPDRAASKLINGFFTAFFHLGGVLVASSNRMPEELSKAAGIEFGALRGSGRGPGGAAGGFFGLGWGMSRESEGERAAKTDFGLFLEVLRARCEVWEMEGEKDYRREGDDDGGDLTVDEAALAVETGGSHLQPEVTEEQNLNANPPATTKSTSISSVNALTESSTLSSDAPAHYHISLPSSSPSDSSFEKDLHLLNPSSTWDLMTLKVYGRRLELPCTHKGILKSAFPALCATYLGPADYVSLCSTFHTIILTDVPVLTLAQKNEARRFITLLDALYEARCRLLIQAAAPPDKLFFPETRIRRAGTTKAEEATTPGSAATREHGDGFDSSSESITSESFSEMYQDSTAPFRPNISSYTEANTRSSTPFSPPPSFTPSLQNPSVRTVLADEDADFGPTYGNGRGHGVSDSGTSRWDVGPASATAAGPDFTSTSALTGEDELFAYKRARSRLWEMCGRKWWDERQPVTAQGVDDDLLRRLHRHRHEDNNNHANDESRDEEHAVPAWWRPVHRASRFWEPTTTTTTTVAASLNDMVNAQPSSPETTTTINLQRNSNRDHSTPPAPAPTQSPTTRTERVVDDDTQPCSGPAVHTDPKRDALFRHDASPYRRHADPPPKFGWQHAWGMMQWGKKAGEWGKGAEGKRARKHGDGESDASAAAGSGEK